MLCVISDVSVWRPGIIPKAGFDVSHSPRQQKERGLSGRALSTASTSTSWDTWHWKGFCPHKEPFVPSYVAAMCPIPLGWGEGRGLMRGRSEASLGALSSRKVPNKLKFKILAC